MAHGHKRETVYAMVVGSILTSGIEIFNILFFCSGNKANAKRGVEFRLSIRLGNLVQREKIGLMVTEVPRFFLPTLLYKNDI